MFPAIFLDRDGVLIENRSDYIRDWSQVRFIPDALEALSKTVIKNHKVVIVTNQSAVGRGLISLETANEINDRLVDFIKSHGGRVDAVYTCPHKPEDDCDCRKPKPGLLLRAADDLSLDLHRSWMIGDAWSDLLAGQAAGVGRVVMVRTGRGAEQLLLPRPIELQTSHFIFNDLAQALDAIPGADGEPAPAASP
jgi:D-glycero-D-manno-heptose 1,7-bisphosphate phosphatase